MAKRKTSSKKKSSGKKGFKSNVSLVLIILVLLVGLVFYGLYETSQFTGMKPGVSSNSTNKNPISKKNQPDKNQSQISLKKTNTTNAKSSISKNTKTIDPQKVEKETVKTNESLPVYTKDDNHYYSSSFDFIWPAYTQNDAIVEHSYYTLKYNEKTEQADWVAYKLTRKNLENAKFKRKDNFKADPDVKTKSASPTDYKGSGYDRGHLAPAADFTWTEQGLDESFFMSNMSPQKPGFNRGIWKKLEAKTRTWAKSNKEIYIVTGPIYKGRSEKIGKNKITVPDAYYKVILELNGNEVKGIAFILNNEKSSADLGDFAMSIDEAERRTNLDFFPSIPDQLEVQIEKTFSYRLWR